MKLINKKLNKQGKLGCSINLYSKVARPDKFTGEFCELFMRKLYQFPTIIPESGIEMLQN